MRLVFAVLLFACCQPAWGQHRKSKIEEQQEEINQLRIELAQCQAEKAFSANRVKESPQKREELHAQLLPLIKARSVDKFAKAEEIIRHTDQFLAYCESIKTALIEQSGGLDSVTGQPKDIRNKEVTTRYLVMENNGKELHEAIGRLKEHYLSAVEHSPNVVPKIVLQVEPLPPGTKSKTWEEFKFKQMPLAAVFPILGKYRSDAEVSEKAVLQYLSE